MLEKTVVIGLHPGLQARPAAEFVQRANSYASELFIEKGNKRVNAKSIMGLMSLAITNGDEITLLVDGSDEDVALKELTTYVENK